MRGDPDGRYTVGLNEAVGRLHGVAQADDNAVWAATAEVLTWLYRCEEAERRLAPSEYFAERSLTDGGQTLAALTWYRGFVDHRGQEVRRLEWLPVRLRIAQGGEWVDVAPYVGQDGEWRPVTARIGGWAWPRTPELPPDRFGRDGWYELHVAGKSVMHPIERAMAYLMSR